MNKAERHRIKMLKLAKRLKTFGLTESEVGYSLRTTGKPCSCMFCDPHKWGEEKFSHRKRMTQCR